MKTENKKFYEVLLGILLIIIAVLSVQLIINNKELIIGKVAYANIGCCDLNCQDTSLNNCPNNFNPGKKCNELPQCNIGCCVDFEDYCLDNYLKSNCDNKGMFHSTSCLNIPKCVTKLKQGSMINSIGNLEIYTETSFLYSEPFAGKKGTSFLIKALLFNHTNTDNIKLNISGENYQKELVLFDNGLQGDDNKNDGLFAGIWNSEEFPEFEGFKTLNLSLKNYHKNQLILSSTNCVPIINFVNQKKNNKNIVFINSKNENLTDTFQDQAKNIANLLLQLALSSSVEKLKNITEYYDKNRYNYYVLLKNIKSPTIKLIIEETNKECNLIMGENTTEDNNNNNNNNNNNTLRILLDEDYPYCKQELNVIQISPKFVVNQSVSENKISQEEFLNNFCKYVVTEKELQDKYLAKTIPPYIEILSINKKEIDDPNINITFIISDNKNTSINYTIYYDLDHPLMYLKQNKTTNGTKHELELNIPDGKHILWIEAKDQDNNFDISKAIPVEKRVNNFTVQIGSLDKISYLTSPQIKFIVTHKDQNQKVSYVVHVDKEITVNGEGSPFMEKTVMMNLTEGEHTIYVTATDQMNNSAISWPYYIIVGSDEEPQMYEAIIDWYE